MTTIGNKETFGFRFELDDDSGGEWMFGRCCYLIDGKEVGEYELGTSLRDVFLQMTQIVGDCGRREGDRLCNLSDKDVHEVLRYLIYEDCHANVLHIAGDIDMPARFDVRIPVDVFDACSVFLLDCPGDSRLVFRRSEDQDIESVRIRRGEFDDVIGTAYQRLEEIYESSAINNEHA